MTSAKTLACVLFAPIIKAQTVTIPSTSSTFGSNTNNWNVEGGEIKSDDKCPTRNACYEQKKQDEMYQFFSTKNYWDIKVNYALRSEKLSGGDQCEIHYIIDSTSGAWADWTELGGFISNSGTTKSISIPGADNKNIVGISLYSNVDDEKNDICRYNDFSLSGKLITAAPTKGPTPYPTPNPTNPTRDPTLKPTPSTKMPTISPSKSPTPVPTKDPTKGPTKDPTKGPTKNPTESTSAPSKDPTGKPTESTSTPTKNPSKNPTKSPTKGPTKDPSKHPTKSPSKDPTKGPTKDPSKNPTKSPSKDPTKGPTKSPTDSTANPTKRPSHDPTLGPTKNPTISPTEPEGEAGGDEDDNKTDGTDVDPQDAEGLKNNGSVGSFIYYIIGAVALCLCCCFGLIWFKKKKRSGNNDKNKNGSTYKIERVISVSSTGFARNQQAIQLADTSTVTPDRFSIKPEGAVQVNQFSFNQGWNGNNNNYHGMQMNNKRKTNDTLLMNMILNADLNAHQHDGVVTGTGYDGDDYDDDDDDDDDVIVDEIDVIHSSMVTAGGPIQNIQQKNIITQQDEFEVMADDHDDIEIGGIRTRVQSFEILEDGNVGITAGDNGGGDHDEGTDETDEDETETAEGPDSIHHDKQNTDDMELMGVGMTLTGIEENNDSDNSDDDVINEDDDDLLIDVNMMTPKGGDQYLMNNKDDNDGIMKMKIINDDEEDIVNQVDQFMDNQSFNYNQSGFGNAFRKQEVQHHDIDDIDNVEDDDEDDIVNEVDQYMGNMNVITAGGPIGNEQQNLDDDNDDDMDIMDDMMDVMDDMDVNYNGDYVTKQ